MLTTHLVTALVTVVAGAAAGVVLPADGRRRLAGLETGRVVAPAVPETREGRGSPGPGVLPLAAAGLCCGAGVAVLVGGLMGLALGVGAALGAVVLLRRLEPRATRDRRERLAADLPVAVELLAAGLAAGAPTGQVVPLVAAALGGPLADDLNPLAARLALGGDPVEVWRETGAGRGPLAPLGRAMARSLQSGAPLAESLRRLAQDLRSARRADAEQRARSVGVRAAAPLGLCFLPAFVLVGIVPSVASALTALAWW